MSLHAEPPRAGHELDAIVSRAGAIRCEQVALHYGSAAGELAACVCRVGLGDRSELAKLSLEAPRRTLEQVAEQLTGMRLAGGGALRSGPAWWCAVTPERLLVLAEPGDGDRLTGRVRRLGVRHPDLRIRDLSEAWSAIAIVGRRTGEVLARLGVYGAAGDPRSAAPVSVRRLAGTEVTWLLQSDHRALALMGHREAPAVWRTLHTVGQPFGICAVGREALARYTLLAGRQAAA